VGLVYLFHLWQQRSLPLDKCRNLKSVKFEISYLRFWIPHFQISNSQFDLTTQVQRYCEKWFHLAHRWIVNGSRTAGGWLISREMYMAPEMAPPWNPNQAIKRGQAMRSDQQFMTFMEATFNGRKNLLCTPNPYSTWHMAYSRRVTRFFDNFFMGFLWLNPCPKVRNPKAKTNIVHKAGILVRKVP